ncbi:hypothetical protein [Shinella kummerowiae]|uniref:hypothetical protein n=1 Tax=Shinella kummerowiae TaxID=417745 RepID=UPI0021B66BCF|nr:hypothetical protein [Shinella kummerowiae]MCT7665652.1 hypothetical protein [Shinella kummerowiae]
MWTPDPAKIITAADKEAAQSTGMMSVYEEAIQAHVDAKPRERAFRDGVTLASYAASTNPAWQAEALAFIAWRDAVWGYACAELAKVMADERERPTVEAFIGELEPLDWP